MVVFAVYERRFFFVIPHLILGGSIMKLFKEVLKNNLKMILFYVVIGIVINFLSLYSVTYYQKILDDFQFGRLCYFPVVVYGILLVISTILGYVENYPEQQVKNKLYLDFKLCSLKKMKSIDYLEYLKIGTGKLTQRIEDGALASRDVLIDFWLKLVRYLIPTALFSLIFILSFCLSNESIIKYKHLFVKTFL